MLYKCAFLNVREILDYISEIHQKLDDINEIKRGIKKDYYENQEAIELISCLHRDRISIDDIHELKYVALRFGKLPLSQIEKIKYFDSYPLFYFQLLIQLQLLPFYHEQIVEVLLLQNS